MAERIVFRELASNFCNIWRRSAVKRHLLSESNMAHIGPNSSNRYYALWHKDNVNILLAFAQIAKRL